MRSLPYYVPPVLGDSGRLKGQGKEHVLQTLQVQILRSAEEICAWEINELCYPLPLNFLSVKLDTWAGSCYTKVAHWLVIYDYCIGVKCQEYAAWGWWKSSGVLSKSFPLIIIVSSVKKNYAAWCQFALSCSRLAENQKTERKYREREKKGKKKKDCIVSVCNFLECKLSYMSCFKRRKHLWKSSFNTHTIWKADD